MTARKKPAAKKDIAPKGAAPDLEEAKSEDEPQPEIEEVGSNADGDSPEEAAEKAPADEPTSTVSKEGEELLDLDAGVHKESELQAAADEEAPEKTYAEQDKLIAEATAPQVDDQLAAANQAAEVEAAERRNAAVEVAQYRVRFNAAAIPVVVDSISGRRAVAVARQFLAELANSPDVSVERVDGTVEVEEVDPNQEP